MTDRSSGLRCRVRVGVEGAALVSPRTGVGRYTFELLGAIASRHSDDVVLTAVVPRGAVNSEDVPVGVGLKVPATVPQRAIAKGVRAAGRLGFPIPFELSAGRQDVMLFPNYRHLTSLARSVTVIYDLAYLHVPDCVDPVYLPRLRSNAERAIRRSDLIFTISETVRLELLDAYPQLDGRVAVVPPGKTEGLVTNGTNEVPSKRDDRRPFLFVGTLEPRKNLEALVAAMCQLPGDVADAHPLVLVGRDGWSNESVHSAIAAAGDRVHWRQYVSDVELASLYDAALAVVFPSRYEGFGLPVLEAMAAGVPVACSDLTVLREVAGQAALYFDHRDPESIASAMLCLATDSDRRGRLQAEGRLRASRWSWEVSADRAAAHLTALVDSR